MVKQPVMPPVPIPADLLHDLRWLLSPDAAPWLAVASESKRTLADRIAELRAELSIERTHLVLEQAALRERAREKFRDADDMFFTPLGMEQATDEIVADYKAQRFAGKELVFDLCTGIGGDLLALARRGKVVGFERDPRVALIVQANARLVTGSDDGASPTAAKVRIEDACQVELERASAWHIDPDRRPAGKRTTRVELHEPSAEAIDRMLARNGNGAIKLAPAAEWPETWSERAEMEWISRGRQCRQLVAWFGDLAANPGQCKATVVGATHLHVSSVVGSGETGQGAPVATNIDRYLFEPDAAVIAANLTGELARKHSLHAIARGAIYLTGPHLICDAALASFEVMEVLPFRLKPLKSLLCERGIGNLEIKKRGVEHDPAQIRRQLQLRGELSATLLIARVDKRVLAILARRHIGG